MKTYKINFQIRSPIITPLQSDTIWGYFAWACFRIWGEKFGKEFIEANKNGEPTLVSNAFPEGYLPTPIIEIERTEKVEEREIFKRAKKKELIKFENFERVKDKLSWSELFQVLSDEVKSEEKERDKFGRIHSTNIMRNKISRLTFTTGETGELFATEETFYESQFKMWFAVRTNFLNREQLEKILAYIELTGFGADASTGRGSLKFISIEEDYKFPESENSNAFMSISNFIPTDYDLSQAENLWYSIFTKYPKVGDYFALVDPFKKPLVFMKAGSVFKVRNVKEFYGCIVSNVHSNPEIVQFAYAFPLKVRVEV